MMTAQRRCCTASNQQQSEVLQHESSRTSCAQSRWRRDGGLRCKTSAAAAAAATKSLLAVSCSGGGAKFHPASSCAAEGRDRSGRTGQAAAAARRLPECWRKTATAAANPCGASRAEARSGGADAECAPRRTAAEG